MPKIDIDSIPVRRDSLSYPTALRGIVEGRERKARGDAEGMTKFGVNLTRPKPGSASSLRHWHEVEEEMVYILDGELVLVEDDAETAHRAGDALAFKPGVANGHRLVNRSGHGGEDRFTRRSGKPHE